MDRITVCCKDVQGREYTVKRLLSCSLSRELSAPCDALRLRFLHGQPLTELHTVTLSLNGKTLFFGYVDTQREESAGDEVSVFVYARSSVCLLLDNEAEPITLYSPSTDALFLLYAQPFRFENRLPLLACDEEYMVSKGTSCFGAINAFVSAVTGKSITVSPDNVLSVPDGSGTVRIPADAVMQKRRCINRGGLISRIDFKATGDRQYDRHMISRALWDNGVEKTRKTNLTAVPEWQRETVLKSRLSSAARAYDTQEVTVSGYLPAALEDGVCCQSRCFGALTDYRVGGICYRFGEDGMMTVLTLYRPIDLKEITYVD